MGKAKEKAAHSPTGGARIGIGLIALGADSSNTLDGCRDWLEGYLAYTFPDFEWAIEKDEWDCEWGDSLWIMDRIQERMEESDWQFSFMLSDVRGYGSAFGSPGTMSFSHSAAIIYLPELFPAGEEPEEDISVIRCCHLILAYFARLNGLPHLEERRISTIDLDRADPLDVDELKELDASLHSMADGILRKGYKEMKGIALYARIIFSHPMRVLRTVRSHRPFRMMFSLGKLVFAAMAALVLALLSTELWYLGVGINTWRLILIAVAVLLASTLYVVFRQRLYVRRVSRSLSEQAAFFNLTSFLTVFSVLLALFVAIFVVTIVVTVGVYPRYIIEDWLGKSDVGFLDYAKVSLLISSMAMVVGALGAGLEENQHFRQVMYTERNR
jgi:hypothetical protein